MTRKKAFIAVALLILSGIVVILFGSHEPNEQPGVTVETAKALAHQVASESSTDTTIEASVIYKEEGDTEIQQPAGSGVIAGRVVDTAGEPVTGARVRIYRYGKKVRKQTQGFGADAPAVISDEDGEFVLMGLEDEGFYDLIISCTGYASQQEDSIKFGSSDAVITLRPEALISGTVYNEVTQNPVAGVAVFLRDRNSHDQFSTATDSQGRYAFTGLRASNKVLVDVKADTLVTEAVQISIAEGECKEDVDLYLNMSCSLLCKVVDKKTGTPIADFNAAVHRNIKQDQIFGVYASASSDTEGMLLFTGLKPGQYKLRTDKDNHYLMAKDKKRLLVDVVREACDEPFLIEVSAGKTIHGRIVNESGEPVAKALIGASQKVNDRYRRTRSRSWTDANGVYELTGLAVESCEFSMDITQKSYLPVEKNLVFAEGEVEKEVDVVLVKGGSISGYVMDEAQQPLDEVKVAVIPQDGKRWHDCGKCKTNAEGFYEIGGIPAVLVYVDARKDGYIYEQSPELEINGQALTDVNLLLKKGLGIGGTVLLNGKPLALADVRFGTNDWNKQATTDRTGKFAIEGITAGAHDVRIGIHFRERANGVKGQLDYEDKISELRAGTSDLVLDLGATSMINGVVKDGVTGEAILDYSLSVIKKKVYGTRKSNSHRGISSNPSVTIAVDGTFTIGLLLPGTYAFMLEAEGYGTKIVEDIVVHEGHNIDGLEIMLDQGIQFTGTVVREDTYEPIKEAEVRLCWIGVNDKARSRTRHNRGKLCSTDESGRFLMEPVESSKTYALQISHKDYIYKEQTEAADMGIDGIKDIGAITLDSGGTITGTIRFVDGEPIAGARIDSHKNIREQALPSKNATSDEQGVYVLNTVSPGEQIVLCNLPRQMKEYQRARRERVVVQSGETVTVDFEIECGETVRLRVLDNGAPLSHGQARLYSIDWPGSVGRRSDEQGCVTFNDIASGRYLLKVSVRDENAPRLRGRIPQRSYQHLEVVEINAGQPDIQVETQNVSFAGCIVEANGRPLGNISMVVQLQGPQIEALSTRGDLAFAASTDGSGRFSMGRITPGTYSVGIRKPDQQDYVWTSQEIIVTPGGVYDDVVVTIDKQ